MTPRHNPALSEEPRNQPMKIFPPLPRETLLSWLENTGRFHSNDNSDFIEHKVIEDLDDILEPEIYTLETEEDEGEME